ncbi:hypothetical protein K469DRAFT_704994 [Zopfia rhizophila CBS 207.26]|uniref:Uncharacterized protein n=1 Tax=Zopfia rhizophila CBS 207.26 TaxID=1314779 RepID=A0A6A6E942_9PEZI|nr:hypothetical protein K469DRAFT_704994 [Zopfia rhizophila CBS 207.26]
MNENLKQVFEEAVIRENCRNPPQTPLSLCLEADDVLDTDTDALVEVTTDEEDDAALFEDLTWKKVPYL